MTRYEREQLRLKVEAAREAWLEKRRALRSLEFRRDLWVIRDADAYALLATEVDAAKRQYRESLDALYAA